MESAEGAAAAPPEDPMAGVPELKSYVATTDSDKLAGMQLVADSIAQMRQTANNALIFNPVTMPVIIAIMAGAVSYLWQRDQDVAILLTTCAGIMMISFALCRFITNPYITAAESLGWEWLGDAEVIVTKFGEEVIGSVIIDWISGESRSKRKKAWRGEIKGWAVRLRYRGKGVGTALLEDVIKQGKTKGAETIEFADNHASKSYTSSRSVVCTDLAIKIRSAYCRNSSTGCLRSMSSSRVSYCKIFSKPALPKEEERKAAARRYAL